MTAFNSVLPELVVLISTTSFGRTELNAVITIKARVVDSEIGVLTPRPPRLLPTLLSRIPIFFLLVYRGTDLLLLRRRFTASAGRRRTASGPAFATGRMTDSPQRAPQKLAKVGSIKEDDDAVRFNPLSATSSQRRLLRKAAGKDTHGKDAFLRHSSSGRDVTDDERSKSNAVDLIMFGLAQQHEKLHAVDYASQQEYRNKRMWVAVAMDSIYVNLLVITTVCVDVFSFLAFELRDSAEQDCFTRAAHVQEALNLFCLGLYTVEILIRGFANGWRHSYSFNKKNADQIFDTAIVAGFLVSLNPEKLMRDLLCTRCAPRSAIMGISVCARSKPLDVH